MFYKRKNVALSDKSKEIYDHLIDQNSDLCRIKKEFDFSFIYDEIKDNYCLDDGRNSIDGVIALRAIFIQNYFGLRERQLERKAMYDIEIKNFLDIEIDSKAFDFTTIWKFKRMLGEEKVESIFNNILAQIKSKGIIHSFRRQAIDTIPIVAAAALPSTTCLIYQTISGVCKSVDEQLLVEILKETELTIEKLENYSKAHPLFVSEQEDRIKAFQKAAKRGFIVLDIADKNQLKSESISLLREILQENVQQTAKEEYEQKQTPHAKKSLVDKDAGFGHKTEEKTVFGYKAGVSVIPEGIIGSV
ncbi:transposase [Candidatus Woesearchaeota archaeon]|nr:transposase [Candidatus Woesearchaeota archaeon]